MPHDDVPAGLPGAVREPREDRDPLDAMLRALPEVTLDRRVEVQTLRRARAVLVAEADSGVVRTLRGFWERAVAPVLVMGTVASYLAWAVQSAGALYR
jgi:hypothetical protein